MQEINNSLIENKVDAKPVVIIEIAHSSRLCFTLRIRVNTFSLLVYNLLSLLVYPINPIVLFSLFLLLSPLDSIPFVVYFCSSKPSAHLKF